VTETRNFSTEMYKVAESSRLFPNPPRLPLSVTLPVPLAYGFRIHVVGIYNNTVTFAGDKRLWAVDIGQMCFDQKKK